MKLLNCIIITICLFLTITACAVNSPTAGKPTATLTASPTYKVTATKAPTESPKPTVDLTNSPAFPLGLTIAEYQATLNNQDYSINNAPTGFPKDIYLENWGNVKFAPVLISEVEPRDDANIFLLDENGIIIYQIPTDFLDRYFGVGEVAGIKLMDIDRDGLNDIVMVMTIFGGNGHGFQECFFFFQKGNSLINNAEIDHQVLSEVRSDESTLTLDMVVEYLDDNQVNLDTN